LYVWLYVFTYPSCQYFNVTQPLKVNLQLKEAIIPLNQIKQADIRQVFIHNLFAFGFSYLSKV
jgi:hypothetical protein